MSSREKELEQENNILTTSLSWQYTTKASDECTRYDSSYACHE